MKRVALLCSEPIRERMAGIGVRYLEFARRLPATGLQVVLFTAGDPDQVPDLPGDGARVRRLVSGSLVADLSDCHAAVVQGGLGDRVLQEARELPVAVDLYDPWLVENLHYFEELGNTAYRRDHASWTLQLSRGDFFLCSSERQRCFYLGWLAAAGRLTPELLSEDPELETLLGLVPFGVPERLPPHRPVLPLPDGAERRVLFGGLYDWLDPWPVLEALEAVGRPAWKLLLVGNPNPETTPQRVWREVEAWCRERGWWGDRVRAIDWVPADRRFDLFRDVDALVVSHRDGPETWLSLRTRALDALAAGCPVVVSDGGGTADLLRRHGLGRVVPPGDPGAMGEALRTVLEPGSGAPGPDGPARTGPDALAETLGWDRALAPLVRFCRDPWRHPTRSPVESGGMRERARDLLRDVRSAMARSRSGS